MVALVNRIPSVPADTSEINIFLVLVDGQRKATYLSRGEALAYTRTYRRLVNSRSVRIVKRVATFVP